MYCIDSLELIFNHIWQELAQALGKNATIESLNIESNYLTGEGIKCIVQVLKNNTTIKELRIANQVQYVFYWSLVHDNHLIHTGSVDSCFTNNAIYFFL